MCSSDLSYLNNDQVITPVVVLLELSAKANKEGWDIRKYINFIKIKSNVIGLNEEIIIQEGKKYNEIKRKIKDFGLIDATILSIAIINKCNLLTGDSHFRSLENIDFLK